MSGVTISALIKKMNLELLTKEINTDKIKLYHPDVNRPALQLAGYYEHFDRERVQLIGVVEYTYMQRMTEEQRLEIMKSCFQARFHASSFLQIIDLVRHF